MLFLLFLGGTKALYKIEVPREGVKGTSTSSKRYNHMYIL
jgi:hypothetical protein